MKGKWTYLYRAVDRESQTLDVMLFNRRVLAARRFIKPLTEPVMGFKAFHSAAATIAGIEMMHRVRKGQIPANGTTPLQTFAELVA